MNKYKYKYKVKTEDEFLTEFGCYWREDLYKICFPTNMDYLLGIEIDIKYYSDLLENGRLVLNEKILLRIPDSSGEIWTLNNQMMKEILIAPNYNEKRKLVYE